MGAARDTSPWHYVRVLWTHQLPNNSISKLSPSSDAWFCPWLGLGQVKPKSHKGLVVNMMKCLEESSMDKIISRVSSLYQSEGSPCIKANQYIHNYVGGEVNQWIETCTPLLFNFFLHFYFLTQILSTHDSPQLSTLLTNYSGDE